MQNLNCSKIHHWMLLFFLLLSLPTTGFALEPEPISTFDGYDETEDCGARDSAIQNAVAITNTPDWSSEFDVAEDLTGNWKSRYAWRTERRDVIINNESQYYVDALGYDASLDWSPFVRFIEDGNGYLGISAITRSSKFDVRSIPRPYKRQEYLSGVLTTREIHDMTQGIVEVRAKMPRGNGLWPAIWLNHTNFTDTDNSEVDGIEYLGQSPCEDATLEQIDNSIDCWLQQQHPGERKDRRTYFDKGYDTWHTQYHNFHRILEGESNLTTLSWSSPDGAIYTNPDSGTDWRGDVWADCEIDFSRAFHIYTVKWNAQEIVWYIDHIEVLRVDKDNYDHMTPPDEPMYLVLNLAIGSDLPPSKSWPGAPDAYTLNALENGEAVFLIDYVRYFDHPG